MDESRKVGPKAVGYSFHCKAIKPPPGTKSRFGSHHRLVEAAPPRSRGILIVGMLVALLGVGIVIGRFLLP
jgi:hypothetical protein